MARIDPLKLVSTLDQPYCCFDCSSKFRIGAAIAADVMRCPKCRSPNMHPIGAEPVQLTEYHGEIGTKN